MLFSGIPHLPIFSCHLATCSAKTIGNLCTNNCGLNAKFENCISKNNPNAHRCACDAHRQIVPLSPFIPTFWAMPTWLVCKWISPSLDLLICNNLSRQRYLYLYNGLGETKNRNDIMERDIIQKKKVHAIAIKHNPVKTMLKFKLNREFSEKKRARQIRKSAASLCSHFERSEYRQSWLHKIFTLGTALKRWSSSRNF